jgi:ribokinase
LAPQVHLVSAVGGDETGTGAIIALAADAVDCRFVRQVTGALTGTAVVLVDRTAVNSITVAPGANGTIGTEDLQAALEQFPPGILVTCFELPPEVVRAAVRLARRADWQAVVNPAPPIAPLDEGFPPGVIHTPNEHELYALRSAKNLSTSSRRSSVTVSPPPPARRRSGRRVCGRGRGRQGGRRGRHHGQLR